MEKVVKLMDMSGFDNVISDGDLVAVKIHFGERGNTAYIHPVVVRAVIDRIKEYGGKPFLTDSNTLYVGSRSNAVDHLTTAILNGFDYAVVGAPLIIADGLRGRDYVTVKIGLKHFKEVKIASAAHHSDALIALSHFKGHEITGFGGALKNLGMGLGSPSGKQMMHSDVLPEIDVDICTGCGKCLKWCPSGAIEVGAAGAALNRASINPSLCIGCGECTVVCPNRSISINWKTTPDTIQEKIAEYAFGLIGDKQGKTGFVNFLTDISPDCDCYDWSDAPLVGDIGFLSSRDPVAIDQASIDLFNQTPGLLGSRLDGGSLDSEDKFKELHGFDWHHQLEYGEKVGLGTREYELVQT